jgi:hypothetical protein
MPQKINRMGGSMFLRVCTFGISLMLLASCSTLHLGQFPKEHKLTDIPALKNDVNECYYLDEFMPVPSDLVKGKNGSLSLRYYSYSLANYKEWVKKPLILAFHSTDQNCWSLFEETLVE